MPDKKKANTKPKTSAVAPQRKTQELSDDLARAVAKKKMTMKQAQAKQAAKDAKAYKTKTIKNTTGKGTPKVAGSSHGKERAAKFRRNKRGNVEAY
jgi:hypothetical protein